MMTSPLGPQRYYNPVCMPSSYRPSLPSQSEAFSHYQSQYRRPISQQPWRSSKQNSDLKPVSHVTSQHQYTQQPFCQIFISQHQNYPYNQCQTLSPAAANSDSALRAGQNNLLAPFNSNALDNLTNKSTLCQPGAAHQLMLHQPY